jgi:hypothetical protein
MKLKQEGIETRPFVAFYVDAKTHPISEWVTRGLSTEHHHVTHTRTKDKSQPSSTSYMEH